MSPTHPKRLAPEVAALLEEVAKNPKSTLLRMPRREAFPDYFSKEYVRPSATGLTPPEVQLVEVFREDVAKLLVDYCQAWHAQHSSLAPLLRWTPAADLPEPRHAELRVYRERAARLRGSLNLDIQGANALEAISQLAMKPHQLIGIALRLVPRTSTRLVGGISLMDRDQDSRAYQVFARVAGETESPLLRSIAWAEGAWALRKLRRNEESRDHYLRSYEAREGAYHSLISALLLSAVLLDEPGVRRHARQLDGTGLKSSDVESRLSHLRSGRLLVPISDECKQFSRQQSDRLSGLASELLDAHAN